MEQTKRQHLSIGEVLELLVVDFPDVTISKIRFLESKGLISPERTPSGYRRFYSSDVDRLKSILLLQKEHYLPLDVIKLRLDSGSLPGPEIHSQLSLAFVKQEDEDDVFTNLAAEPNVVTTFGSTEGIYQIQAEPDKSIDNVTSLPTRTSGFTNDKTNFSDVAVGESGQGGFKDSGNDRENFYRQRETKSDLDRAASNSFLEEEKYAVRAANVALEVSSLSGAAVSKLTVSPNDILSSDNSSTISKTADIFTAGENTFSSGDKIRNQKEGSTMAPVSTTATQDYFLAPSAQKYTATGGSTKSVYSEQKQGIEQNKRRNSVSRQQAVSVLAEDNVVDQAKNLPEKNSSVPIESVGTESSEAEASSPYSLKSVSSGSQFNFAHSMYSKEELLVAAEIDAQLFGELLEYGLISAKRVAGEQVYDDKAVRVAALVGSYAKFGIGPRHLRSLKHAAEREASMYQQSIVPFLRQRNPDSRKKALDSMEVMTQLGRELKDCLLRIEIDDILGGKTR